MKYNGGIHFLDTFRGLKLEQSLAYSKDKGLIDNKLYPLAKDIDGQLLCVQSGGGNENLVIWEYDSNSIGEDLKQDLG